MELGQYKVTVPKGNSGRWSVDKIIIDKEDKKNGKYNGRLGPGRWVPPGTYTRLVRNGDVVVMSDTPAEIRDHLARAFF